MPNKLFSLFLGSIILLACAFSSGWAQWTVDITVTSPDPSVTSKQLTFGTDINVPKVSGPWPPPPMGGSYLNAAFSVPPFAFYSTYTDANGPWLLRIQTNVNFIIEWDSIDLSEIPAADGIYSVSKSLHDGGLPVDMGLLHSKTTLELPPGNYDITTTKITATSKTLSISGTDAVAFDGTGVAIQLTSGGGDMTITRNAVPPSGVGEKVLPVHWNIQSDISGVTATLIFYYDDAEVTAMGLNENTIMLGFNNGSSWQVAPTQRDTTKNKLWTTTNHFSSIWTIGEEGSLPVILSSFVGYQDSSAEGVTLEWRTDAEVNLLQWNIYRSESKNGKYTKINSRGIPAVGNSNKPKSYKYIDAISGRKIYYYYLEAVDVQGNTERSTIITVFPEFDLKTSFHTTWGKLKSGLR